MASATLDSELMTDFVSATKSQPVNASSPIFLAIRDRSQNPAIFEVDKEGKLLLTYTHASNKRLQMDFGEACGIYAQGLSVGQIAAHQEPSGHLHIGFSSWNSSTSSNNFHYIPRLHPRTLGHVNSKSVLTASLESNRVKSIHMSNHTQTVGGLTLPQIHLVIGGEKRLNLDDVAIVNPQVSDGKVKSISVDRSFQLFGSADEILDISPGTSVNGDGMYFLFKVDGDLKLQFQVYGDTDHNYQIQHPAPDNANSLSSFKEDDSTNLTSVLVGGHSVYHYSNDVFMQRERGRHAKKAVKIISFADENGGEKVGKLHNTIINGQMTTWITSDAGSLYYYNATQSDLTKGTTVQLLGAQQDATKQSFSAMTWQHQEQGVVVNSVVYLDGGDYHVLHQSLDTGYCYRQPLYVHSENSKMDIHGHTVHVRAHHHTEPDKAYFCQMFVTCSDVVWGVVNGQSRYFGPKGAWYQANAKGDLDVIIHGSQCHAQTFTVTKIKPRGDEKEIVISNPTSYDPNLKLINNLKDVKDAESIKNSMDAAGVKTTLASRDYGAMAKAIRAMADLHNHYSSSSSSESNPVDMVAQSKSDDSSALGQSQPPHGGQFSWYDGNVTDLGGGLEWLSHKISDVHLSKTTFKSVNDIKQKKATTGQLIFTLHGEKQITFVIDSTVKASRAATWLVTQIVPDPSDVIKWLGFTFDWSDITECARNITNWFNVLQNWCPLQIDGIGHRTKDLAGNLKKLLRVAAQPTSQTIGGDLSSPGLAGAFTAYNQAKTDLNWAQARMFHFRPGGKHVLLPHNFARSVMLGDSFRDLDQKKHILHTFELLVKEGTLPAKAMTKVAKALIDSFGPETTSADLFDKTKAYLSTHAADLVKKVTPKVHEVAVQLLSAINAFADMNMSVPLFTQLWKDMTGQDTTSLIEVISLILAIPMVSFHKSMYGGEKPPDIRQSLNVQNWSEWISGTLEESIKNDWIKFGCSFGPVTMMTDVSNVLNHSLALTTAGGKKTKSTRKTSNSASGKKSSFKEKKKKSLRSAAAAEKHTLKLVRLDLSIIPDIANLIIKSFDLMPIHSIGFWPTNYSSDNRELLWTSYGLHALNLGGLGINVFLKKEERVNAKLIKLSRALECLISSARFVVNMSLDNAEIQQSSWPYQKEESAASKKDRDTLTVIDHSMALLYPVAELVEDWAHMRKQDNYLISAQAVKERACELQGFSRYNIGVFKMDGIAGRNY